MARSNMTNFGLFVFITIVLTSSVVTARPQSAVIRLTEDTWDQMLTGEWMVEFFAPWCPACKNLEPVWNDFANWGDDLNIKVAAIDVTVSPGLSGRFIVTALPTIYHVKDGVFRQYVGSRDLSSFSSFIEERKWEKVEQMSSWKAPDSILMSLISYFFKISMALRSIHNRLVDDYGIPYWGSYVLFALATILFGVILGLMIVCVIDVIFPSKPYPQVASDKKGDANGDPVKDTEEQVGGSGVRRRDVAKNEDDKNESEDEADDNKKDN